MFMDIIDQPIVVFQDGVIFVINLRKEQRYEFGFFKGKIMIEPKQQPDFICKIFIDFFLNLKIFEL